MEKTKRQIQPDANTKLFTAIQIIIFQKRTAIASIQI